ncbi:BEM_HP_G0080020.mRNA.1.CDS.1 [Saccharomyces cerevisiae]|nr:BEM_HP_G0080020.mRNA.1.CDS.1 [Saccharomyces cerevisiae]CAI6991838.1 BEM_HP_G0080020.mRNA.1.CDS.1 [Saccharomyces cerevisiae]
MILTYLRKGIELLYSKYNEFEGSSKSAAVCFRVRPTLKNLYQKTTILHNWLLSEFPATLIALVPGKVIIITIIALINKVGKTVGIPEKDSYQGKLTEWNPFGEVKDVNEQAFLSVSSKVRFDKFMDLYNEMSGKKFDLRVSACSPMISCGPWLYFISCGIRYNNYCSNITRPFDRSIWKKWPTTTIFY